MMLENKKKLLGQFDTPLELAHYLYRELDFQHDFFIDLGAGTGNLSHAAQGAGLQLEIDLQRIAKIPVREQVGILKTDILSPEFEIGHLIDQHHSRLFISNPPFAKSPQHKPFTFFTQEKKSQSGQQLDVLFLDRIMQQIRKDDAVLLIISSPFLELELYRKERMAFFNYFNDITIYSLPVKTFKRAEVQAYAIIAKNSSSTAQPVRMLRINTGLKISEQPPLIRSRLGENLNFRFQSNLSRMENITQKTSKTLKEFEPILFRGNSAKKDQAFILHTSDLNNHELALHSYDIPAHYRIAKAGDILIARVGNVIGRCALITSGHCALTDVVICLRVRPEHLQQVWASINSESTRYWLKHHAQGKCAKYITHHAINGIPIV